MARRNRRSNDWHPLDFFPGVLVYELMMRSEVAARSGPEGTRAEQKRMEEIVAAFLETKATELDALRADRLFDLEILANRLMPELADLAGVPRRAPPLWAHQVEPRVRSHEPDGGDEGPERP